MKDFDKEGEFRYKGKQVERRTGRKEKNVKGEGKKYSIGKTQDEA